MAKLLIKKTTGPFASRVKASTLGSSEMLTSNIRGSDFWTAHGGEEV